MIARPAMVTSSAATPISSIAASALTRCSAGSASAAAPSDTTTAPTRRPRPYSLKTASGVGICRANNSTTVATVHPARPAGPIAGGSAVARQSAARNAIFHSCQCLRIAPSRAAPSHPPFPNGSLRIAANSQIIGRNRWQLRPRASSNPGHEISRSSQGLHPLRRRRRTAACRSGARSSSSSAGPTAATAAAAATSGSRRRRAQHADRLPLPAAFQGQDRRARHGPQPRPAPRAPTSC